MSFYDTFPSHFRFFLLSMLFFSFRFFFFPECDRINPQGVSRVVHSRIVPFRTRSASEKVRGMLY